MELTETQKAYLAGFFDGEGCVMAYRIKRSSSYYTRHPKAKPGNHYYAIRVQMAQKDMSILKELQEEFGGWFGGQMRHRYYQWQIYSKVQVETFLTTVLPYLRVKKKQAEMALELCSLLKDYQHRGKGLSDEDRAQRDRLVDAIKKEKSPSL